MKKSLLTAGIALLLCGYASAFKVTVTPLGGNPCRTIVRRLRSAKLT